LNTFFYLDAGGEDDDGRVGRVGVVADGVADVPFTGVTRNLSFIRKLDFGRGHSVPVGQKVHLIFANRSQMEMIWGVKTEQKVVRQVRSGVFWVILRLLFSYIVF